MQICSFMNNDNTYLLCNVLHQYSPKWFTKKQISTEANFVSLFNGNKFTSKYDSKI